MHRPHPLFAHLTSLSIAKTGNALLEDARVFSYVLAHARQLTWLRLEQTLANMDDAFNHRLLIVIIYASFFLLFFLYGELGNSPLYYEKVNTCEAKAL